MASKGAGGSPTRAILAIILVIIGLAFLFQNFGLLRWGVWGTLWRFWPVLLVVVGIYLILGRSRPGLAAGLSLVAIVVAFGLSWASGKLGSDQSISGSFSEPLGNLERAVVDIQFGAGELTLDSLPAASAELVHGEFEHHGLTQGINKSFKTQDRVGRLELNSPIAVQQFLGDLRQSWQVRLTPSIPLELNIKAGASKGQLNLTNLRVNRLRMDIGASKATINLPRIASGTVDALIKAGAADLTIIVPQGTAARIKPGTGPASLKIDDNRFYKTGDYYVSPGFAEAGSRIELEIAGGLARIEIR